MTDSRALYPISSKEMLAPPCDTCKTHRMCSLLQMACYEYACYCHQVTCSIRKNYRHDRQIPNTDIWRQINRDRKNNREHKANRAPIHKLDSAQGEGEVALVEVRARVEPPNDQAPQAVG